MVHVMTWLEMMMPLMHLRLCGAKHKHRQNHYYYYFKIFHFIFRLIICHRRDHGHGHGHGRDAHHPNGACDAPYILLNSST
jgi:hypothetical protein